MSYQIKKKETALKHIREGKDFATNEFKLFWDDREVVLEAILKNRFAICCASKDLKADRKFILEAVARNGGVLEHIYERFNTDKEVVLAAVKNNSFMIKYASETLKSDKAVVLAAVEQDGWMLKYALGDVLSDKGVVLAACLQHSSSIEYASHELQELCEGHDPVETLERAIAYEKLHAEVPSKSAEVQKPVLKW